MAPEGETPTSVEMLHAYLPAADAAPPDAVRRTQAEWGQGDRGAEGYEDAGGGGLYFSPSEPPPGAARAPAAYGTR